LAQAAAILACLCEELACILVHIIYEVSRGFFQSVHADAYIVHVIRA